MTAAEAALAGLWLLSSCLATLASAAYLRGLTATPPEDEGPFPPVLVLLPIRAATAAEATMAGACLAALAGQTYRGPWRVAVIVEDAADLAWPVARSADPARFMVLCAGPAQGRSQKVHNLLAGLATRRAGESLATLDADTVPPPGWLADLTRPVRRGYADVASGYRWPVPVGLPARLLALAEQGPATFPRPSWLYLCWGGSTAIGEKALAALDLPAIWRDALSDDLALTVALRRAGMRVWTPRRVLVPSPVGGSLAEVLRFGRRQYMLVRLHAPDLWLAIGVSIVVPAVAAWATLLAAARGSGAAWIALAIGFGLQQWRAHLRRTVARRLSLPVGGWRDALAMPLVAPLQAAAFLASAIGREIAWGGRRYRLATGRTEARRE